MRNLQVYLRDGQLLPISRYDAEQLEDAKPGQAYNLKPTGSRSNPHHNLYWSALRNVCKATGKWPTEKHLHEELKFACGYYQLKYNSIAGKHMQISDSIQFSKMNQAEFHQYFEAAMEKLAEAIGYDPLES